MASEALPHSVETGESTFAARGNAIHEFLERLGNGASLDHALDKCPPEHRDMCQSINIGALSLGRGDGFQYEVTFAMDVYSGRARVLGTGLGRDYSGVTESEVCGTADVIKVEPGHVYITDYKTGRPVARPESNWQLIMLALMASAATGRHEVTASITYINPDGSVREVAHRWDEWDLLVLRGEMAGLVKAIAEERELADAGRPPSGSALRPGEHCRYCPAFRSCPAQISLLDRMVAGHGEHTHSMTDERAHAVYETWHRMRRLVADVGSAIHAHARSRPIPLPDGRVFGEVETSKSSFDGLTVVDVLSRMISPEVALSATSFSVTKTGLTAAIREHWLGMDPAERPTLKAYTAEIMDEVDRAGGISTKSSSSIREHRS